MRLSFKRRLILAALSLPLLPGLANAASNTSNAYGLPTGLPSVRNNSDSFTTTELITTSVKGMMDRSCGGYCVIGVCAHLVTGWSWRKGPYAYTVISPRLRHPVPDLLVTSYNHVGDGPYLEWRATVGTMLSLAADPLGIAGGRPDPKRLDEHQSVSFKEVDIIGHPLALLPQILDRNGNMGFSKSSSSFSTAAPFKPPTASGRKTVSFGGNSGGGGIDVTAMLQSAKSGAVATGMSLITSQYQAALLALQGVSIIKDIKQLAQYFKTVKTMLDTASAAAEISARSSIWGNVINPRFESPRMFCPNSVKPLQPYYLSFADAFWWRAGYPITDGPFSGSDHSALILNPFGSDTLPVTANALNPLAEVWGNKYPREGMLNQSHDAKTASVIAWRGMDVLQKSIPGARIGVKLPDDKQGRGGSVGSPRWQMIYPEVKSCQPTPYYPPSGSLTTDFMEPNDFGSYAWNYYRTYTCCSNTRGRYLGSINFPLPLCITI